MIFLSLNPGSTNTKFSLYDGEKELLKDEYHGEIKNLEQELQEKNFTLAKIHTFGIRIVHGGTKFSQPTRITPTVLKELKKLSELAPLHNPPAIRLVEQLLQFHSKATIYAVFDTAFHSTIEEKLTRYPIPKKIADDLGVRKFGFHGIACQSVITKLKQQNALPKKLVICHLGGGASVTAVKNGTSVDTSMGFTPLEGLMMVTRSGSIDEGAVGFLQEKLKLNETEVLELLNKQSGILGIAGTTDVKSVFEGKTADTKLAREMFLVRVIKYIFAAAGILGGLDRIVLSGGIGSRNVWLQKEIQKSIKPLNCSALSIIDVDEAEEIRRQVCEIL
jgi:acetate kinase